MNPVILLSIIGVAVSAPHRTVFSRSRPNVGYLASPTWRSFDPYSFDRDFSPRSGSNFVEYVDEGHFAEDPDQYEMETASDFVSPTYQLPPRNLPAQATAFSVNQWTAPSQASTALAFEVPSAYELPLEPVNASPAQTAPNVAYSSPQAQQVPGPTYGSPLDQPVPSAYEPPQPEYGLPGPQSCVGSEVLDADGHCVEPEIIRNVYTFAEPENVKTSYGNRGFVPKPKIKFNLVVIQANNDEREDPIIIPPAQEKTVVLVLKKDGDEERKVIEVPAPPGVSPEVYFVNYKEGENPTLPGGIDLHTALASSATQGTRFKSTGLGSSSGGSSSSGGYSGSSGKGGSDYKRRSADYEYENEFGDKYAEESL